MNETLPRVVIAGSVMAVRFSDSDVALSMDIVSVVDYTDFGDVVGIEILES